MKVYCDYNNELIKKINELKIGDLILLPTDTVYGLAIKLNNFDNFNENILKLYKLKNRDIEKKIILLLSDTEIIYKLIDNSNIDNRLLKIINKYMPGPLSIVLNSNNEIKEKINYDTIGIRIPNHKLTRDIIRQLGGYLFVTSANISGMGSPINFLEIDKVILNNVGLIIKDEENKVEEKMPSTILDYTNKNINIIREGKISKKMLEEIK